MNLILKRAAAGLLSAALLSCGAAIPAAAAEQTNEPVDVKTVCTGYEPLSDDLMFITLKAALPVRAELIQHSLERDPLVLYDSTLTGSTAGTKYRYAVERGDYTLRLTYSPATASKSNDRTVEYNFTMPPESRPIPIRTASKRRRSVCSLIITQAAAATTTATAAPTFPMHSWFCVHMLRALRAR